MGAGLAKARTALPSKKPQKGLEFHILSRLWSRLWGSYCISLKPSNTNFSHFFRTMKQVFKG